MKLIEEDLEKFLDTLQSEDYRDLCNYILRGFVGRELEEGEVKRYAKKRYEKPSSYNLCLALFKSFANWKMRRLDQSDLGQYVRERQALELVRDLKRERVVKRVEKKGLTIEEIVGVLKRCKDELRFAVVFLLMYFGVRPGELVALEPKMVNFKSGRVTFETEKTRIERQLPFDSFVAKQLRIFLCARPSYPYVYKVCKEVGIEPKSGRQTFNTHQRVQAAKVVTDPVKIDWLIKVASGHTVGDIGAVYTDIDHDMEKLFTEYHYMKPLEAEFA